MLFFKRRRIVELAAMRPFPAIYYAREFFELGGFLLDRASVIELLRQSATYPLG
jgi:hypothetical protein